MSRYGGYITRKRKSSFVIRTPEKINIGFDRDTGVFGVGGERVAFFETQAFKNDDNDKANLDNGMVCEAPAGLSYEMMVHLTGGYR